MQRGRRAEGQGGTRAERKRGSWAEATHKASNARSKDEEKLASELKGKQEIR